jgi:hypothetical protein
MNADDLLPLALRAIDDPDARLVLADVLLETGWWDERLTRPGFRWESPNGLPEGVHFFPDKDRGMTKGTMSATRARGIATVLLFGGWSDTMWPVVERAKRPLSALAQLWGREIEAESSRLRRLYSQFMYGNGQPDDNG